ncbi:MAG TPA: class I SAM-dependent methyltransferase [Thermohalobaculum sp.]|nr:class I SAM-dependent methyltransferase [Thermohalobaculum sp.]
MTQSSSNFDATSGDGYELQMGRFSRRLAGRFLDFTGVSDLGRILDAGCGTGALSAELLRRTQHASIAGVDIAPAYVAYAASTTTDDRIAFTVGNLEELTFADGEFGQVFSQLVLNFVPRTDLAISELVRVTAPAGTVSAAIWDVRGGLLFNRLFFDTASVLDPAADAARGRNLTRPLTRPGTLAAAWEAAGLTDLRQGEVAIRMEYSSFDDYWAPCDGDDGPIAAYLKTVGQELRSRIKDAVRRAYLDGDEDGPRSYTATAWVVKGTKPSGG